MVEGLNLSDNQVLAMKMALDCYIRMGLGQFSELATRFDLMYGKKLTSTQKIKLRKLCDEMEKVIGGGMDGMDVIDRESSVSSHVLNAWLIEAQMLDQRPLVKMLKKKITALEKKEKNA